MKKNIDYNSLYDEYAQHFSDVCISDNDKALISVIMEHGLIVGTRDDESILAIHNLMSRIHGLPYNITLYRSGSIHPKNKPYISASISPDICKNYHAKGKKPKIHSITVKSGTPLIPLSIVNPYNLEYEIILDASRIHRTIFGTYIYK